MKSKTKSQGIYPFLSYGVALLYGAWLVKALSRVSVMQRKVIRTVEKLNTIIL